jgi:DNA-binding NarL/FixJ family response regulator
VSRLASEGLSNREIARIVHLAEDTVKNHASNILTKLKSRDRTQAALYAIHWKSI